MEKDQNDQPLPPGLRVDELLLLVAYQKLEPALKEDARRFITACLRHQGARRASPSSNVVKFPAKRS